MQDKKTNPNTENVYNPSSPALEQFNAKQLMEIFSVSGTSVFNGYYDEDDVRDWNSPVDRAKIVNDMRRKSVAIQSGLNILKAPILTTGWSVNGGDEEQRAFIEKQLFGMSQRTWQEFLNELLNYLEFGFSLFEIIFKKTNDGKIGLYDLAPRIQESIQNFRTQDGNAGVTQLVYGDIQLDTEKGSASIVSIPLQKLLIFTNNKEGDNLMGSSILRSARMHYDMIQIIYRISAISAERFGVGIPIIKFPNGMGAEEKESAEEMGRNLKGNEKGYIALSEDWTIELLMPSGGGKDALIEKLIAHHNRMLLISCMAHSLDLGSGGGGGSYALSENQGSDRMSFAEQKATYIANQINKYVVKKLIDLNWGVQDIYPQLEFEALGIENSKTLADTYKALYDIGIITNDVVMINYIRKIFNLPQLTEEEILVIEQKKLDDEQKKIETEANKEENNIENTIDDVEDQLPT